MKVFLLRPGSVLTAIVWSMVGVAALGLLATAWSGSLSQRSSDSVDSIAAMALGNGDSINLEAVPAHPFLAEYRQAIVIYNRFSSTSAPLGKVEILANTGGRIRIGVLIPRDGRQHQVMLVDRTATTQIDLDQQVIQPEAVNWRDRSLKPLG